MTIFKSIKTNKQVLLWPQWLAAFEVFLMSLMYGVTMGWIIPFVGKLSLPNASFEATEEDISWVASLINLGRPFGSVVGTVTSAMLGSKCSVYMSGFYFFIGWVSLIVANNIKIVFISLIFNGIGIGVFQTTFSVYIAEISDPTIRGKLIGFIMQGFTLGNLLGNITGAYLEPWMHGVIHLVPTILYIITFIFFPHTPHFLIRSYKMEEAKKSIKWYNQLVDSQEELENLTEFLKSSPRLSFLEGLRRLNTPVNRSTFIKINVIFSLPQLLGLYAIIQYMEILFMKSQISVMDPSLVVIIQSILSIAIGWISALYISDTFSRISILLVSCAAFSIATIGWGSNYLLLDLGFSNPNLQWLTITSAFVYRITLTTGFLPTVYALVGEMFAPNIKNVSLCLTNVFCAFCAFLSCKNYPILLYVMTYEGVFYTFALGILLIGIYAKFYIVETKGQTLQDIQAKLNERSGIVRNTHVPTYM